MARGRRALGQLRKDRGRRPVPHQGDNSYMKVLDLKCAHQHVFEGWFASEDDFQSQMGRGLVTCPMCGDATIEKQLSAPRLNFGATAPEADVGPALRPAPASMDAAMGASQLQAMWLKAMREVVARTEDVGEQFAEVARQIHHGQAPERGIRGRTSPEEAAALLDEGIAVMPLMLPDALKEPLQ
jgi:hypothetical protein